jgi:O-methyltransferase
LAERPARAGEIMVEAGCWQGGSTAKFSLACRLLGYQLHVYDSFEGVEELSPEMKLRSYDYSGEYKASEQLVREHLARHGAVDTCTIHKGWFAETLAIRPVTAPVRVVYIDCDLARGTREVLQGTVGRLVPDGWVFSQDYHIQPVRELLHDPSSWDALGHGIPTIRWRRGKLAALRFGQS